MMNSPVLAKINRMMLVRIDRPVIIELEPSKPVTRRTCRTKVMHQLVNKEEATSWFDYLRENVTWGEGVRSKKGFTRKAAPINLDDEESNYGLKEFVTTTLTKMGVDPATYDIEGIYLNYYEDGSMWTPNHTHPGLHQLVISLGASRTFVLGKKEYTVNNGDVVIFGSAVHGIPKEPEVTEGRISIATFMRPI